MAQSQAQKKMAELQGKGPRVLQWKKNSRNDGVRSYHDIDADVLRRAISLVTAGGGAIMFGVTSDGGAYSVCVLHNQDKLKEYPHTAEELSDLLEQLSEQFTDLFTG